MPDQTEAVSNTQSLVGAVFKLPESVPFKATYYYDSDVLEVEGIRYAGDYFRMMARDLELGVQFELLDRGDGVITIRRTHADRT